MRTSEEVTVDAWGLTLAARWWPGEGMPVLALHGWLDNANSFAPLAEHLPNPVLAMDFAGHGLSAHRPQASVTHYIDHVRDVLAVADACGWERFILLGHSMGAGVACLFAGAFPERVGRLVLIEGLGPPSTPPEKSAATLRKAVDEMAGLAAKRKPVYEHVEQAVRARMTGFGGLDEQCARLLCERGLEAVKGGWTWRSDPRLRLASSLRLTEEQVEGFLRAVQAPALLVLGSEGLGGNGMFDHRRAWMPDLQVEQLPGRHHLHMEKPEAVAELINPFCRSRKAARCVEAP